MNVSLLIAMLLAGAALLWTVLLTFQAHEHRRYVRTSLRNPARPWHAPPRVLVCVPCKGLELDLADNLQSVLSQEYANFSVRFIVDSKADPACKEIRQLMAATSVCCELVVAGTSTDSGQKVHNLCCATADLPEDVEVLAFFDSDARPAPDALARLVDRVCRSKLQVATGYRWFVPQRPSVANLTLASINASVAGLLKHRGRNLIWGGCWAITRDLFEHAAVADAWRGTLSDDLVASRVLRRAGANVVFEPGCMSASSLDVTWTEAVTFLRRQFLICRCYVPLWWWVAAPLVVLQLLALSGGVTLAGMLAWQGNATWFLPLLVSAVLYAFAVLRSYLRQTTWGSHVRAAPDALRAAARFDRWAFPWTCLFATGVMLSSAVGRSITWRGIRYHMGPAGRITMLGRVLNEEQRSEILEKHARRIDRNEVVCSAAASGVRATATSPATPLRANDLTISSTVPQRAA